MEQKEDENSGTSGSGYESANDETEEGTKMFPETGESVPMIGPTGKYTPEYKSHEQYRFLYGAILNIYSCSATFVTCV